MNAVFEIQRGLLKAQSSDGEVYKKSRETPRIQDNRLNSVERVVVHLKDQTNQALADNHEV